jgi:hypothetical protein
VGTALMHRDLSLGSQYKPRGLLNCGDTACIGPSCLATLCAQACHQTRDRSGLRQAYGNLLIAATAVAQLRNFMYAVYVGRASEK